MKRQYRKILKIPGYNPITYVLKAYMKQNHISEKDLAEELNCSRQDVSYKLNKAFKYWTVNDILVFSELTKCPLDVLLDNIFAPEDEE